MKTSPRYGIIGSGRVAKHFKHYLALLGLDYSDWSRTSHESLENRLKNVDVILILVSDQNIESVFRSYDFLKDKLCVHFSGVLNIDGVIGMHPLMTFTHELYEKEVYEKIPFVVERGGKKFKEVFPDLNNPHYEIERGEKAIYHAKCVMASNFMMLMWNSYFDYLNSVVGMDKESAFLLLETTLSNMKHHGLEALTGPLVRKDFETIKKNISSLGITGEDQLYREFIKTYFPKLKGELCLQ